MNNCNVTCAAIYIQPRASTKEELKDTKSSIVSNKRKQNANKR